MQVKIFRNNRLKQLPYGSTVDSGSGAQGEIIQRHNLCDMQNNTIYIHQYNGGVSIRVYDARYNQPQITIRKAKQHQGPNQLKYDMKGEYIPEQTVHQLLRSMTQWKNFIVDKML